MNNTKSKFDGLLSEAAYAVASHGFADAEFGTVDDVGWNALAVVHAPSLLNIGEEDLARRVRYRHRDREVMVWIAANSDGSVYMRRLTRMTSMFDRLRDLFDLEGAKA